MARAKYPDSEEYQFGTKGIKPYFKNCTRAGVRDK